MTDLKPINIDIYPSNGNTMCHMTIYVQCGVNEHDAIKHYLLELFGDKYHSICWAYH